MKNKLMCDDGKTYGVVWCYRGGTE